MRSQKSKAGSVMLLLFLIGLPILLLSSLFRRKPTTSQIDKQIQDYLVNQGLTPDTAQMWAAVARHESADYTSNLAVNHNNLFGMGYGSGKGTDYKVATPIMDYAGYYSIPAGLNDLVLYQRDNSYPKNFATLSELIRFMKAKGYFTDSLDNYLQGVIRARNRAGFNFNVGFTGTGASGSW